MKTLKEFKEEARREGLHVAIVPHPASHLETKVKTIRKSYPPEPGWPEGRTTTTIGREVIPVSIIEGKYVAKMRLEDFVGFKKRSRDQIGWERENGELCVLAARSGNAATSHHGPGYSR